MTNEPRRYRNISHAVTTTAFASQDVYICPANTTAIIKEIIVTNIDGTNNADITLALHDDSASSAQTKAFVSTKQVNADDFLRLDSANIYLEASDKIQAQAHSANGDLNLFLFIEEYYDPSR